jgi:hypothetical protein
MGGDPRTTANGYGFPYGIPEAVRIFCPTMVPRCHDNVGPKHHLIFYFDLFYGQENAPIRYINMGSERNQAWVVESDIPANSEICPAGAQKGPGQPAAQAQEDYVIR